ncbi:hypothetical protein Tco_0662490 [Tanacetum coccineum]
MESGSYSLDKVWTSIWRDVRSLAIEEAYTTKYSIHPGANTMLCGFRLTNRWLSMKKDIASCGNTMCYVNIFHVMPRVSALAGCDNNQDDDQEDGQNDEDQDDVNERIDSDNNGNDFVHPKLSIQDQEVRHNKEESDEESNEESDEEIQGANVEEEELDL